MVQAVCVHVVTFADADITWFTIIEDDEEAKVPVTFTPRQGHSVSWSTEWKLKKSISQMVVVAVSSIYVKSWKRRRLRNSLLIYKLFN